MVTLANLGYIYLLQRDFERAIQVLEKAEESANNNEDSILRVAYWYKGDFHLLPEDRHPRRFRNTLNIIRANLAIANYLGGKTSEGISIAKEVVEKLPKESVGYRVLGCLYLVEGDVNSARTLWQQALELRMSKWEREIFKQYLEDNPAI